MHSETSQKKVSGCDISIIITAHNRKEFIMDAVSSILIQNESRLNIEIIVVKNFLDDYLDEWLENRGIRLLQCNEKNLGRKFYEGIKRAQADIISLMEDDDIFLPDKLSTVLHNFDEDPDLIYYHNAAYEFQAINEISNREVMTPGTVLSLKGPLNFETIMRLQRKGAHGNNSCISIRKEVAIGLSDALKNLNPICDGFIMLWCSATGKNLKFDNLPLTGYRIHQSFSHVQVDDMESYIISNSKKARLQYNDKKVAFEMLSSIGAKQDILLSARYSLLREQMNLGLFAQVKSSSYYDLLMYLVLSVKSKRFRGIMGVGIQLISIVSRNIAIKLAYQLHYKKLP